jgi:mycofactocin system glycosyltransferase
MVHPDPAGDSGSPGDTEPPPVTVIIPVKDDQAGLDATLAGVPGLPVVVVDDGSRLPMTVPADRDAPTSLIRRDRTGGPGVARQEGLAEIETPVVAFVDAGVEITGSRLRALARWFTDPTVSAVAPRVAATPRPDLIARYEAGHSPLDLGPVPSAVGHGRLVSYLPTACLLARKAAVEEAGGFDPELRFGEDVDLVWRLQDRGQVRYDPSVVAHHPPRPSLGALARQRYQYGLASAPLAARYGSALAPVRLSPWTLAVWAAVLARRPLIGLGVAGYTARALSRKLAPLVPDHEVEAVLLTVRGHLVGGLALAEASARIWWPVSLAAHLAGARWPVRTLLAAAWLRPRATQGGSLAERLRFLAVRAVDDVAFGTGAWVGAIRQRSARCLAPQLVRWPTDETA